MSSQAHYIASVKQLFKWLTQENYLLYNPASELIAPKRQTRLLVVLSPLDSYVDIHLKSSYLVAHLLFQA
jgi:site-specific recombinase XerD